MDQFLKFKSMDKLDSIIKYYSIILSYSIAQSKEIFGIIDRKFEGKIQPEQIHALRKLLKDGRSVVVTHDVKTCRDPNDDFLLSLALSGKADYLLTGDQDLLVLGQIESTLILRYRDWREKLRSQ